MPKSSARDRLRGWARAWIERFESYTNFIDSLKIPARDYPFYSNSFFETLANDKALNCEPMAVAGYYIYLRCGKLFIELFIETLTDVSLSTSKFMKEQIEVDKLLEKITRMLKTSYYHPPIDVKVYVSKEIEIKDLSEALGETKISEVDVGDWWVTVRFEPTRGAVTLTLKESGRIEVSWMGEIERWKLEDIAEQDLANYIQELNKALTDLYNVVKAGMRGIVNYVLY